MKLNIEVDGTKLIEHVKRICRRNLKKPAKICLECPFIKPVLVIMDRHKWKYNKEAFNNIKENKNGDT